MLRYIGYYQGLDFVTLVFEKKSPIICRWSEDVIIPCKRMRNLQLRNMQIKRLKVGGVFHVLKVIYICNAGQIKKQI